jgi:hypothetical protein
MVLTSSTLSWSYPTRNTCLTGTPPFERTNSWSSSGREVSSRFETCAGHERQEVARADLVAEDEDPPLLVVRIVVYTLHLSSIRGRALMTSPSVYQRDSS